MHNRIFAARITQALDDIEMPPTQEARIDALSKLLDISKFAAENILNGIPPTETAVLTKLAQELEVSEAWLLGAVE